VHFSETNVCCCCCCCSQSVLREEVKEKLKWTVDRSSPTDKLRDFISWYKDIRADIKHQKYILSNFFTALLARKWYYIYAVLTINIGGLSVWGIICRTLQIWRDSSKWLSTLSIDARVIFYIIHRYSCVKYMSNVPMSLTHCTVYTVEYSVQCALYTVQCTLYSVHCTLYTVHCIVYSVHCTVYTVQCTVYCTVYCTKQCTLYSLHCTVYTVQCTLCSVHGTLYCTAYTVQCTLYTVHFILVYCTLRCTGLGGTMQWSCSVCSLTSTCS